MLHGVDVSHWQGSIDWKSLKNEGISFACMKATDGVNPVDIKFKKNIVAAKASGVLCSAYHFFRPDIDPIDQANLFIQTIKSVPQLDFPPMFDFETLGSKMNVTDQVQDALTFLKAIESDLSVIPIIYSGFYFINSLGNPEEFSKYPFWLAAYNNKPRVPAPWIKWTFWQYTSTAKFSPMAASFDSDWFDGSVDDLKSLSKSIA